VAGNSVVAALAITTLKIVVGVTTGSLGILSEALHSVLDLVAAIITLMSVRVSDKPADADHQYGHGKVENFSAFIETFLSPCRYRTEHRCICRDVHFHGGGFLALARLG
jgi:cation diffusion facilitator family transporter